jgi:hypothetical protein
MANPTCEHKSCNCTVETGKRFCSDACRDLASAAAETPGRCGCDHPACAAQQSKQ